MFSASIVNASYKLRKFLRLYFAKASASVWTIPAVQGANVSRPSDKRVAMAPHAAAWTCLL